MSDDVAAIEARLAAATPGPWHVEESRWDIPGSTEVDRIVCGPEPKGTPRDGIADVFDGHWVDGEEDPGPAPNLELIVNAPADLAYLLAEIKRLRETVQTIREVRSCLGAADMDYEAFVDEVDEALSRVAQSLSV